MSALNELIQLSQAAAIAPSLTQGGGGNTSVKHGEEMLIKASGFRLDEVSETIGFVKVNFQPVQTYLKAPTVSLNNPDADLKRFVNVQIVGDKTFLPSMETGFHAVLKSHVIHTHPVIANLLMCSTNGSELLNTIFNQGEYTVLPFLNPGYYLSKAIADVKAIPDIIFLQNHGLIVHANNAKDAIALQRKTIERLERALDYSGLYDFEILPISEQLYELKADWLNLFFSQQSLLSKTYFPDQAVVIGYDYQYTEKVSTEKKLNFVNDEHKCLIKAVHKNALAIAENLCALANIIEYNQAKQQTLTIVPEADVAYILGMDMEKYRQGLLNKNNS